MQVSVEDINSVKKTLHIEIPEEKVIQELDKAYNKLRKNAKVKGFRPGKVPRSVVVRLFKKDVHADVTSNLIQSSFVDALKETDLKIVGTPNVDPPELEATGPYRYDATVEISPELEDIEYRSLPLKRTNYKVLDEEIEAQLKMLQKNMAQHQKIEEDRPVQKDDFVLIDFEGFRDGQPFAETAKTENYNMKIGQGTIIKDFDDQLIGMRPGDKRDIEVKFPPDYFNKKLADLDIQRPQARDALHQRHALPDTHRLRRPPAPALGAVGRQQRHQRARLAGADRRHRSQRDRIRGRRADAAIRPHQAAGRDHADRALALQPPPQLLRRARLLGVVVALRRRGQHACWRWTVVGPLAMLAMFVFASIPMLDDRSRERCPAFADYEA